MGIERKLLGPILATAMAAPGGCNVFLGSYESQSNGLEPQAIAASPTPEPLPSATLAEIPSLTPTPIDGEGYFEGLVCPPEDPEELHLPEVGDVIEFQGLAWKVVGVNEGEGEACEGGIQIVLEFCPCEQETPTPTPTARRNTNTPRPPTDTPESPIDTPEPPTKTPTLPPPPPTATIPPTMTAQPPEPTVTMGP